jgi:hypothetical protein
VDWNTFDVISAVVHYVPTEKDEPDPQLLLTDEPIALDDSLKEYFRDKIADRIENKGLDVIVDDDRSPIVPDAVAEILADPTVLIDASKRIAEHLDHEQSKVNSSGLLALAYGTLDGDSWLAIVKLERERGVRFAINTVDGKHVVDLELLRNLTLTDKTKVYKTAVLTMPAAGAGKDVFGLVADDQRSATDGTPVAGFFLGAFLGCKPREPAAETTFKFVKAANASINEDVRSAERRGRYQVALLATMQDATKDIRPKAFATKYLDQPDQAQFLKRVEDAGIDPNKPFPKDTSRVKVSSFKMTFESGMVLVGDRESLDKRVDIPKGQGAAGAADGKPEPVKLHDTVESVITGR